MADDGARAEGSSSQATASVTAPIPTKVSGISPSAIKARFAQHGRSGSKGSTYSLHGRHPSAASKRSSEEPPPPTRPAQRERTTSQTKSSGEGAYEVPEGNTYTTGVTANTPGNPLAPHINLIITSLAATALISLFLSGIHWSLGVITIGTGCYILSKALMSRGEDVAYATRIADNEAKWSKAQKVESVEWINHILGLVWPLITVDIFMPFIDLLEDALQLQVPGIVHAVRVEDLDQGVIPLKIQRFKVLGRGEEDFLRDRNDTQIEEQPDGIEESVDLGEHVSRSGPGSRDMV